MRRHWQYFKYIMRHKWFVLLECWLDGLYWRGIVHDLSKFSPSEWREYVWRFAYKNVDPRHIHDKEYLMAFNHHLNKNDHHWQHWCYVRDSGEIKYLPMPDKARREMLADWRGMGRALGKPDTRGWYLANSENIHLHPDTRKWVDFQLKVCICGDMTFKGYHLCHACLLGESASRKIMWHNREAVNARKRTPQEECASDFSQKDL